MKIVVTIRKLDNQKEKINQINKSEWIFPYKKYTFLCGKEFTAQKFNIRGASQISFPTKRA